jgi:hypothetical protein
MAKPAVAQQTSRTKNAGSRKVRVAAGKDVGVKKQITSNKKDAQHVVEKDGRWIVKSARSGRFVSQPYLDKREAIDAGRRLAQSQGSDLLIQGQYGQTFQHSPAVSLLPDDIIRKAIRSTNKGSIKKTAGSKNPKKSAAKKK